MANEATRIVTAGTSPANPIRYQCNSGSGWEKGTILKFSGANNVVASSGTTETQAFAGYSNTEHVQAEVESDIGVDTCAVYDCVVQASGFCVNVGDLLALSGANILVPIKGLALSGAIIMAMGGVVGKALEPIAVGSSDTIKVASGIY